MRSLPGIIASGNFQAGGGGGITVTDRGMKKTAGGTTSTNTLVSNSFTPASGAYLGVMTTGTWNLSPPVLAVTDSWGNTWTRRGQGAHDYGGGYNSLAEVWTAPHAGSGAGTITVTRNAGSVDQFHIADYVEVSGVSSVGATAGTQSTVWVASLSVTMSGAPAASSIVLSCCDLGDIGGGAPATLLSPPAGWTEITEWAENTWENASFAYKIGSVPQTWSWANAMAGGRGYMLAAAVELAV